MHVACNTNASKMGGKKKEEHAEETTLIKWLELEASATLYLTLVRWNLSVLDASQSAAVFTYTTRSSNSPSFGLS